MDAWTAVAARFAVYATLALVFGAPLQALADRRTIGRRWLLSMVVLALASSVVALLALVAAMAGAAILPVDVATLRMVLADTAPGTAFVIRFVALGVAAVASCWPGGRARLAVVCLSGAVALATVAWTGHGAMDDGAAGTVHLVADILHMLAGSAWIGAIAVLLTAAMAPRPIDPGAVYGALHRFAVTGSLLVGIVAVTGGVNAWMILGPEGVATVTGTLYGRLLLVKLSLFAAMLALAARHRWMLGPALRHAIGRGDARSALRQLRQSIAVELSLGLAILAIVACLGTLSPQS